MEIPHVLYSYQPFKKTFLISNTEIYNRIKGKIHLKVFNFTKKSKSKIFIILDCKTKMFLKNLIFQIIIFNEKSRDDMLVCHLSIV